MYRVFYCIPDIVRNGLWNNVVFISIIDEDNYDKICDFMVAILNFAWKWCWIKFLCVLLYSLIPTTYDLVTKSSLYLE